MTSNLPPTSLESPLKRAKKAAESEAKDIILSMAVDSEETELQWESFHAKYDFRLTDNLINLDNIGNPIGERAGCKLFKLDIEGSTFLNLSLRESKLYVERDCYHHLFDAMMKNWESGALGDKNIVLTGNSGIGKSWFHIYLLRRLLHQYKQKRQDAHFRLVLRHVGGKEENFFLIDLESRRVWQLLSRQAGSNMRYDIDRLVLGLNRILYTFEPGESDITLPLTVHGKEGISYLSPNPKRIKQYRARFFYMYLPLFDRDVLGWLADFEADCNDRKRNTDYNFEKQYNYFGGVIRRTLEYSKGQRKRYLTELNTRIGSVTTNVLRAIHVNLDDNPQGSEQHSISGYIASYCDIPEDGENCFEEMNLTMTSEYARKTVDIKLGFKNVKDHAESLALCLDNQQRDITGKDLEVSAAHMIATGQLASRWEYTKVGNAAEAKLSLTRNKMDVYREDDKMNPKRLNYPRDPVFGLVDFYFFQGSVCWAFQTTWQSSHPFKLLTLWSFRQKVGLKKDQHLNLLFVVPPKKFASYVNRKKDSYLVKGESIGKDLFDGYKEESLILKQQDVQQIWESTDIMVAQPSGSWQEAIKKLVQDYPGNKSN